MITDGVGSNYLIKRKLGPLRNEGHSPTQRVILGCIPSLSAGVRLSKRAWGTLVIKRLPKSSIMVCDSRFGEFRKYNKATAV